jgi:colicin import membrane protein
MAKQTKKQKFELATLDANNIVELDGWKAKQASVIKENPFIEIEDRETYEIAKSRRTALVSARTEIQKQDKFIGSVMSKFRKQTIAMAKDLIAITEPHEEKQQNEVSRYEQILEEKRREKEMAEQKRVKKITDQIDHVKTLLKNHIEFMTFENIQDTETLIFDEIVSAKDFDFEEFEPMIDEVIKDCQQEFENEVARLKHLENVRLEQLGKDQLSKINSIYREASKLIDEVDFLENGHSFDNYLNEIFDIDFDFGKHKEEFEQTKKDLLFKAKEKMESLKIESERQKEIQIQENKNRIMNVREGLLDRIFQMTTDDHELHLEYIKNGLDQENPFPELKDEFNKMIQIVKMNLDSKLNMINNEIVERQKQARDARIAIDARTAQREKQLEKIGFTFNEQKSENFWNHLSINLELWESMIEGLSDEEWTPYFNDIDKRIQDANEKNKAFQKRQKSLKQDKALMVEQLDELKDCFPEFGVSYKNEESQILMTEIKSSFDLFMKTNFNI